MPSVSRFRLSLSARPMFVNLRFTVPYADEVYALRVFVPQESIYVGFEGAAYETLLSGCKVHDEQAVESAS